MHGLAYDEVHDEIVIPSPLAQAVLVFRGAAEGEEPPLRVIQGPHTGIVGTGYGALDTVSVDGENNEIYLPVASDRVLVFDRMANGDVAPKRILGGPDTQIRYPVPAGARCRRLRSTPFTICWWSRVHGRAAPRLRT